MRPAFSFSTYLLSLPFEFVHWWFIESTFNLLKILHYILNAASNLLGVKFIFKTFFKPWKNEYREGLAHFALFMGIFIKSMLLVVYTIFFAMLSLFEFAVLVLWILFPIFVVLGIYKGVYAAVFST